LQGPSEAAGAVGRCQVAHSRSLPFGQHGIPAGIAQPTGGVGLAGIEASDQTEFSHDREQLPLLQ
jgi:hypothetical protein